MNTIYDIEVQTIDGETQQLSRFKDKVLLVVNVASKCGFTSQYAGLEDLYQKYHDKGLEVLGFPCNQFGSQEPGQESEIKSFCSLTYDVTFPLFSKIDVNGEGAHPLYKHLKAVAPGVLGTELIKWNFTKFLIDRTGAVVDRFAPSTSPASLAPEIEKLL